LTETPDARAVGDNAESHHLVVSDPGALVCEPSTIEPPFRSRTSAGPGLLARSIELVRLAFDRDFDVFADTGNRPPVGSAGTRSAGISGSDRVSAAIPVRDVCGMKNRPAVANVLSDNKTC
jgi:hypothetical protein